MNKVNQEVVDSLVSITKEYQLLDKEYEIAKMKLAASREDMRVLRKEMRGHQDPGSIMECNREKMVVSNDIDKYNQDISDIKGKFFELTERQIDIVTPVGLENLEVYRNLAWSIIKEDYRAAAYYRNLVK